MSESGNKLTCCPHCKGVGGYEHKFTTEYIQYNNWNGEPWFTEQTGGGKDQKTKRCVDCGKKVVINDQTIYSEVGED